jgi:hypothetical protein
MHADALGILRKHDPTWPDLTSQRQHREAEKVCIVTGMGGSMRRATATAFAREGAAIVGSDLAVEQADKDVAMVEAAGVH